MVVEAVAVQEMVVRVGLAVAVAFAQGRVVIAHALLICIHAVVPLLALVT